MAVTACTVLLLKTLKPVAKEVVDDCPASQWGGLTYKTDRHGASLVSVCVFVTVHVCMCVCVYVSVCVCVAALLASASRPTEERRKSSSALHHMPNMSLPANLWGILASASNAEFLTEGDE